MAIKVAKILFLSQIFTLSSAYTRLDNEKIEIDDPNLGKITRDYILLYPDQKDSTSDSPPGLIFHFHGWTVDYRDEADQDYNKYVDSYNYIMVYARGLSDLIPQRYPSWNINEPNPPCTERQTNDYCYESCKKLDLCYPGSWTTCYDDTFFIQKLLEKIIDQFGPININKFVITGGSNGGMFTYALSSSKILNPQPSHYIPWFGNVPLNYEIRTNGKANLLSVYDRYDRNVPMYGGESNDYYIYESETSCMEAWRKESSCLSKTYNYDKDVDENPQLKINTPLDDNPKANSKNFACTSAKGCNQGSVITSCHYDGYHGSTYDNYVEMHLWWIYNFTEAYGGESAGFRIGLCGIWLFGFILAVFA